MSGQLCVLLHRNLAMHEHISICNKSIRRELRTHLAEHRQAKKRAKRIAVNLLIRLPKTRASIKLHRWADFP